MHPPAWPLAILITCTPAPPCSPPPYADLSRWGPAAAQLETVCGVATRAEVDVDANGARSLGSIYSGDVGDLVRFTGRLTRVSGTGRLSADLWGPLYGVARGVPNTEDRIDIFGFTNSETTTVRFLGQDGPMRYRVEDVSVVKVEWTP